MSSINAMSSLQSAHIHQKVDMAVTRKILDQAKMQGQAAVSLLDAAVEFQQTQSVQEPGKGQHIDIRA